MGKEIIDFFHELGLLKKIKREGWRIIGVDNPESVADHSLRTAQIAYVLAKMENHPYPEKVCALSVFHDMAECRVGDLHKIAQRYVNADEKDAAKGQTSQLGRIGKAVFSIWEEAEGKHTSAAIIAKDADLLEVAISAKEYSELGHKGTGDWIKNASKNLKTKSAKKLVKLLRLSSPNSWWKGLKKP